MRAEGGGSDGGAVRVRGLTKIDLDVPLLALGLLPHLATEDLTLLRYRGEAVALGSIIEIASEPVRGNARRRPFLFPLARPAAGLALRCDFPFRHWEKNWMPFEYRGKLLAVRWFSPHTVVEIDLDTARCRALHATPHPFGAAGELHGGTAPLPFDDGRGGQHFLALARLRAGAWGRNQRESRDYLQLLYLFDAAPPFGVSRVSAPLTLPSCVQQRLHMRIQVAKTFVAVAGGYTICWGELDCYSCCAFVSRATVLERLQLPR